MQWNAEWTLIVPVAVTTLIYLWGVRNVWKRSGAGHGIALWRSASFLGAILALGVALVSPLDAMSGQLFSAHMVQHMVLILVAAPLLVISDFPQAILWALPRRRAQVLARRLYHSQVLSRAWRAVSNPISAWLLFTITLWVWHASMLFESALHDESIHGVEHLAFFLTAMLFWWVLFARNRPDHIRYGMAVPYLFATGVQSTILGALMTFSPQPWYPYYADLATRWGLAPLQDQQLAGLIMWVPGGFVYSLLTIGYFAAWLGALERRSVRSKRRDDVRTLPRRYDIGEKQVEADSSREKQLESP